MGETADKIESFIDEHREHLGSNLRELEGKVKSETDWRTHFDRHTGLALGIAVGGGALLALTSSRFPNIQRTVRRAEPFQHDTSESQSVSRASRRPSQIIGHVDQMKSALIDVAAAGIVGYVDRLLPGFRQQVEKRGRPS
jgi:hypothetical protein